MSYLGRRFEVPFELAGCRISLAVDPHAHRVVGVEDDRGKSLGQATALDTIANCHRPRHKNTPAETAVGARQGANLVEIALARHHGIENLRSEADDTSTGA